jgi:hypothetical protein
MRHTEAWVVLQRLLKAEDCFLHVETPHPMHPKIIPRQCLLVATRHWEDGRLAFVDA